MADDVWYPLGKSKCPKVAVILTNWEVSVEASESSYKSLLFTIPDDHTVVGAILISQLRSGTIICIAFSEQCRFVLEIGL